MLNQFIVFRATVWKNKPLWVFYHVQGDQEYLNGLLRSDVYILFMIGNGPIYCKLIQLCEKRDHALSHIIKITSF